MALICGMMPFVSYGSMLSENDADNLKAKLEKGGIPGFTIDINVRIEVPKEKNPHMDEDVTLWATVIRPNRSYREKTPTILVATPYNRLFITPTVAPIITYGYTLLVVDIMGSGSSGGPWEVFSLAEQYATKYVIDDFIPAQEWSDGNVGMFGPSYMGIIQMLVSGIVDCKGDGAPVHLKALFPLVTFSDLYRDGLMQGGTLNLTLESGIFGIVETFGLLPPLLRLGEENFNPTEADIKEAEEIWVSHWNNFPDVLSLVTTNEHITDSTEVYDQRSPMSYWPIKPEGGWGYPEGDQCVISPKLPVFLVSGWYDILTRGTLNNYQYGLSMHADEDKALLISDWYHTDGSFGLGIPALERLALPARWFDWKIKGKEDVFMKDFPVVMRVLGVDRWRAEKSWPLSDDRTDSKTLYLSKAKAANISGDAFTNNPENQIYSMVDNPSDVDFESDNPVMKHSALPKALHGMDSRSSARWLLGVTSLFAQISKMWFGKDVDETMYYEDERSDEWKIPTFTTEPLSEDMEIVGPLALTFWARTEFTSPYAQNFVEGLMATVENMLGLKDNFWVEQMEEKDVQWVVELNDVYPEGRAKNLTSGWLRASHRQYDPDESEFLTKHPVDPSYTPFDPFYTYPDHYPKLINEGDLYQYVVELWPTCNVFKRGHRIRISLSGSDFPHLVPILRPSTNTIVITEDYPARLDFKIADNSKGEGVTWKWVGPGGTQLNSKINDYLLHESDSNVEMESENASPSIQLENVNEASETIDYASDRLLDDDGGIPENQADDDSSNLEDTERIAGNVKNDMDQKLSNMHDNSNSGAKGCFISSLVR